MELGEKILKARLEAGLSQRQLCGEEITRNMLSQIEHGTARPSMKTLQFLASRLGKSIGYFLDEEAEPVPGGEIAEALTLLHKAETAIGQEKFVYAEELLEKVVTSVPEFQRRKLLLLARLPGAQLDKICGDLPSLDEELLLRAENAFSAGQWSRCLHLLEAVEFHNQGKWHMLRGQLQLQQQDFAGAAEHFHRAEETYPEETAVYLEQCYRELEDFKQAYFYACKQKK